jgi:hypothetical protein
MSLILSPSFNSATREEVEEHLEAVRDLRLRAALEFQQGKEAKLEKEYNHASHRLQTTYAQLGKALSRLEREMYKVEDYLNKCEMLSGEAELAKDRIEAAKD